MTKENQVKLLVHIVKIISYPSDLIAKMLSKCFSGLYESKEDAQAEFEFMCRTYMVMFIVTVIIVKCTTYLSLH